jgi:hypothetical protein
MHSFSVSNSRVLAEPCALMHRISKLAASGFLQKIQLPNYASIVPRSIVWVASLVLVEDLHRCGRNGLELRIILKIGILNDLVYQMRL